MTQLQHYMGGSEDGSGVEDSWHLYWRHSGSKVSASRHIEVYVCDNTRQTDPSHMPSYIMVMKYKLSSALTDCC